MDELQDEPEENLNETQFTKPSLFICDICGMDFTTKTRLDWHFNTHTDKKVCIIYKL